MSVLANADIIACEDTRTSGTLLKAFGIKTKTISYHDHNSDLRRPEIIAKLRQGQSVALISDAGMPCISDPGYKLVRDCRASGLPVTVIPGASASLSALALSGLPTDSFLFEGFLPSKSTARKKRIETLRAGFFAKAYSTIVFYESPQRVKETLKDLLECLGADCDAVLARELTKLFEEVKSGTLEELAEYYAEKPIKGEVVILVSMKDTKDAAFSESDIRKLLKERLKILSVKDAVKEISEISGLSKKEVYAMALRLM